MRLRIAHRTVYRYDPPAAGVIQMLRLTPRNHDGQYVVRWRIDVSARRAARRARRRLRQYHPCVHRRRTVRRAERRGRRRSRDAEHQRRRARHGRAVSAEPVSARHGVDAGRRRHPRFRPGHPRRQRRRDACASCTACSIGCTRTWRTTRDDADGAANAAEAFARKRGACPRPDPYFHRRRAQPRHPGALCRRLFPARGRAESAGRRAMPGRKPLCPISAGSASIPPTASARPTAHVRVAVGLDSLGAAPVRRHALRRSAPKALAVAIKVGQ